MNDALESTIVSTRQQQIAAFAKQNPEMGFTSLNHHIDLIWLREAYRRTRKDAAAGVDGQSAGDYAANLETNLRDLLERAKSGRYRAPAVRRVHIPKGDGQTRPIGIPTFEDKILQRAITMVLEPIYEQDFLDCSYGFRPGRSAHQALEAFWRQAMNMGGCWVIELDIKSYFDTVDRSQLREFLHRRVRDGVVLRLIGKWLNAGVLERGVLTHPDAGTPQGGVASPLLANIYLHHVLDVWFEADVKPHLKGQAFLVRFADDAVLCFSQEADARRVLEVLPKRFAKYGLTLHPAKTRLIDFRRPYPPPGMKSGGKGIRPGNFDLLGFTHYWGASKRNNWVIKRKTAKGRFTRAVRAVSEWCRDNRHLPIGEQQKTLSKKIAGHCGYYGITGNSIALSNFVYEVKKRWRYWLARRSRAAHRSWEWFNGLLERFPLPQPICVHSIYRAAKP